MSFLTKLLQRNQTRTQTQAPKTGAQPAESPGGEPVGRVGLPLNAEPDDLVDGTLPSGPLLDVRTAGEFRSGRVKGALHVDIMAPDFLGSVDALGLNRDAPVYLYCRTGNRSGHAAQALRQAGYSQAVNVGGLDQLLAAGAAGEAD